MTFKSKFVSRAIIIFIVSLLSAIMSIGALAYVQLSFIRKSDQKKYYVYGLYDSSITFQSWSGLSQEARWAIDYASRQWNTKTGVTKLYHSSVQHNIGPEDKEYDEYNLYSDGDNLIYKGPLNDEEETETLMRTDHFFKLKNSKYYIYESDIFINSNKYWNINGTSTTRHDVQNVMTHEFGHMLGLDEEEDIPDATMYPECIVGETKKRTLHQDDINGFNFLYG